MANKNGTKWNKGGSLSRNKFRIDWSEYEDLARSFEEYGVNLKETFNEVMEKIAKDVQEDTKEAVQKSKLPAKGKYSQGNTEKAIFKETKVDWAGTKGTIHLGFDRTKPNAGNFLITGTPRMQPARELEKIYASKKYINAKKKEITNFFVETLEREKNGR